MTEDSTLSVEIAPPTDPGFYRYSGGGQTMIFLLDQQGQWWTFFDNGDGGKCEWGYIEQALGVWDLIKIEGDGS